MPVLIIQDGDRTCAYRSGFQSRPDPVQSPVREQPQSERRIDHDGYGRFEPSLGTTSSAWDDEIPGWLPEYRTLD